MKSPLKTILTSGFVAGTLDMCTACFVYAVIMQKTTSIKIMRSIASGVFKQQANADGLLMPLLGLLFHYIIAFSFAIGYFFIFPYIPFLHKNKIISGILYGIFVWIIMNLIVLRLVFAHPSPITLQSFSLSCGILILMIGLPISFITHRYYTQGHSV
jgi:uncharacterized membrane protein YagU involved in acid resistance